MNYTTYHYNQVKPNPNDIINNSLKTPPRKKTYIPFRVLYILSLMEYTIVFPLYGGSYFKWGFTYMWGKLGSK